MLLIGSHVGFNKNSQILGSLEEALSYGENVFMFYTGAPQNTIRGKIDADMTSQAKLKMKELGLDYSKLVVHAPYIINLASSEQEKYDFSISFLKQELKRCEELGINKMVLHPGSHVGVGKEIGIKNIIYALNEILKTSKVVVLLETMAGKGTEIGSTFEEIKKIIDGVEKKNRIGVCLDTCHLNDAGYNVHQFDELLEEFDRIIGLSYIKCIHINDSKNECASHKDRHENFGFGTIGFDSLIKIVYHEKLKDIPKILETPYIDKNYPPYRKEIEMIKSKKFNPNLIEEIKQDAI